MFFMKKLISKFRKIKLYIQVLMNFEKNYC